MAKAICGLPLVWTTYRPQRSVEEDIPDLLAHGVTCLSWEAGTVEDARRAIEIARRTGITYHISLPEITDDARFIREAGQRPVGALMIGGVCRGKAIDRHLFAFTPGPHTALIEPPVYNRQFAYAEKGADLRPDPYVRTLGHYFPDMPDPVRAEVVVPLQRFDGRQHLRVLPAQLRAAPAGKTPRPDSVSAEMPKSPETENRKLYELSFDLAGLEGALLDHVGLAVYWPYRGSDKHWMFGHGASSARAESTREALRQCVRRVLTPWTEANGGTFPGDVVRALRFGDECFFVTGHLDGPACSYPLWDFSEPSLAAFRRRIPGAEHPRTWGFPEIYGAEAYAWWMYLLHESCAELCGIVREEAARLAPGVAVFRNTTRMGVFDLCNEHDGSGQELLTRNLDVVHLDPYPVTAKGYGREIVRDTSYCAGLARRYGKPLIPWMQAHTYGGPEGLQHVSLEDVRRMAEEQRRQGVDGVVWLGYGERYTFPAVNPASWEAAGEFHRRLSRERPPKPKTELAVLRGYRPRAMLSLWEGRMRNPADWLLQQWLEVWAVENGRPYDVFELPPLLDEKTRAEMVAALSRYRFVVGTEPWPDAWMIGEGTEGRTMAPEDGAEVRAAFLREMNSRGWLA
jgi:hypothetical protein